MSERIGIIGLGYVGLPVALAFADRFPGTVGFDRDAQRIAELREGYDRRGEADPETLRGSNLSFTADPQALAGVTCFIVTVPTPIDQNRQPDLAPLQAATRTVGEVLGRNALIVFESTVYPGVTEDICGPLLAETSGLRQGTDFKLAYSPERLNPGDDEHSFRKIRKVVAGEDEAARARVATIYGDVVDVGVYRAPSIKAAEAAKVIENTQRDLNIALMNELALIFDRLGIPTRDVLEVAGTKWNFLPFRPGLVGGHCIGVDPYYLTAKAESTGYHPQVILAGRRINDGMGQYVGQRLVKLLAEGDRPIKGARVGILGLTFKEDVRDLRNSRVPDIIDELRSFGIEPLVHDPVADATEAEREQGVTLSELDALRDLDALVLAVGHSAYREEGTAELSRRVRAGGVLADVKSMLDPNGLPFGLRYWSL